MRVSKKGQVTIPKRMRDAAGLNPGTELDMCFEGDGVLLLRARATPRTENISRGSQFIARLIGSGDIQLSTDKIMKLTRG